MDTTIRELKQLCPEKLTTAESAVEMIKNGSRIFVGSGCGEPQRLVRAMVCNHRIQDAMIYQMYAFSLADHINDADFWRRFSLKLFFVSDLMRRAAFEGKVDYIPAYLSEIPHLFDINQIGLEVALIQISPIDRFGFGSLGVSVDVTKAAIANADLVIAQVNPQMPCTWGDSFVHVDEIDYLVPCEEPLVESLPRKPDETVVERIGHFVSELVDDGATLQVGFGHLPYFILQYLDGKKELGIHTQMITDAFVPLFEKGVVTNKNKNFLPGRAVATLCMGSKKIYDYIDKNPRFYFRSADFVNDPLVIARNDNFISISSALEVDLSGQVCSDSIDKLIYSGSGDQANFIRGAAMSKGGFSIVALPSTAKGGNQSRIVPYLSKGAGTSTLRADVDFVVTEYGIAQLRGKSIFQRAVELTQIAHPKFRSGLIETAKRHHLVFPDQLPPPAMDLLFIEKYKSRVKLKSGQSLSVRPLLPSDEIAYRNFFYKLKEETVYLRFFSKIKVFSRQMAQAHWAELDYRKNITLIGLVRNKGNKEIIAIGTYMESEENRAEVAFVVREDFQGQGIASFLLNQLETIAKENGFQGFTACVLADNKAMLHVFNKHYPGVQKKYENGTISLFMDFNTKAPMEQF